MVIFISKDLLCILEDVRYKKETVFTLRYTTTFNKFLVKNT